VCRDRPKDFPVGSLQNTISFKNLVDICRHGAANINTARLCPYGVGDKPFKIKMGRDLSPQFDP